jgi:hypothetical protein
MAGRGHQPPNLTFQSSAACLAKKRELADSRDRPARYDLAAKRDLAPKRDLAAKRDVAAKRDLAARPDLAARASQPLTAHRHGAKIDAFHPSPFSRRTLAIEDPRV